MGEGNPNGQDFKELLLPAEVARALRIHVNTLKRMSPSALPYFTVNPRGDRRYFAEDVKAYIERRMRR